MKFLSTRRRHPLAGLVVLVLGLVLMGGLYSAFRPASADQSATDTALISQGRRLFVASCSSCHGLNAEGVRSKHDTNFGPPLIGVGAAAVDFQVGTGRMPAARPGTQIEAADAGLHARGGAGARRVRRVPRPRPGDPVRRPVQHRSG